MADSFRLSCEVYGFARGSPFGRAAEQGEAERARMLTAKHLPHFIY